VTSRTTEIQTLIADIDSLLANKGNRLSKILSGQGQEPRQALERIRNFLVRLTESETRASSAGNQQAQQPQLSPLLEKFVDQGHQPSLSQQNQPNQEEDSFVESPQIKSAFSTLLMPLQAELQALLQERTTLVEEIRQLEQRRLQNYSLSQQLANQEKMISEFLQVLMSRLTSSLTIDASSSIIANKKGNIELAISSSQPLLESPEQVERLTRLAKELDQQLLGLDGTVNVVFDALQRNIHTYHDSLSQALVRMHSKGVQGEQLLANWIDNLMDQLPQQTVSNNPSTLKIENETPPQQTVSNNPSTLKIENETPLPTASAVTTDDLNPLEVNIPSTLANKYQETSLEALEDASTTPDLDAMILQLNQDPQNSATLGAELQHDNSELSGDEVDQLYASLFGSDNLTDSSLEDDATRQATDVISESLVDTTSSPTVLSQVPVAEAVTPPATVEVIDATHEPSVDTSSSPTVLSQVPVAEAVTPPATVEVIDATHEPSVNTTASASVPVINQGQQVDAAVMMPDPWFDGPDAGLLDLHNANTEDTPIKATEDQSSDFYNLFISQDKSEETSSTSIATPDLVEVPLSTETITGMVDSSEQVPEVASSDIAANSEAGGTPAVTAPVEMMAEIVNEPSSDHYMTASPQENLLVSEASVTAVPDISLEESQLRQLEQDLADFDGTLNLQPQPASNPESQETSQNTLTSLEMPQHGDAQESSTIGAFFAEAEKNQEVIIESHIESHVSSVTEARGKPSPKFQGEEASERTSLGSADSPVLGLVSNSSPIDHTESLTPLDSVWYLGLDLGTTGISAALLNRSTIEIYPLYWSAENQPEANSIKRSFRLPAEVYLPTASVTYSEAESQEAIDQTTPASVAEEKVPENLVTASTPPASAPDPTQNLFSAQLKPYLQVALPYKSEQQKWEPVLQLNEFSTVPLVWVVRSLSKLLLTLTSDSSSTTLGLTAVAVGLSQQTFHSIIQQIAGVICTCPSNWSEQYRFNVREALLISKLVQHPQQVFFVEEAIASLLSELDGANGETVELNTHQGSRLAKTSDHPLFGSTLVINIGAAFTEMALVDLPEHLEDLTHSDFMLHGFAYAGKGIEQDIICQLLFPPKWRQSRTMQGDSKGSTSNPGQWQPAIPGLDQMHLSNLAWEELNLPRPGEPDISDRICLQQRLEGSLLGKAMLDAAIALKLILQHQDSFTLELADQQWVLQRRDLESQVFVPFVRRLNRELNRLLVAKGIPTEAINQAILTGGVASISAVSRWLRQKVPNAKIIQDLYLGENGAPTCSRVAYGLAMLPLHPQVLEISRQQYTDYFLFTELLSLLPDRALSFDEVIQLFENRGINTRNCQQRLLAFLEGELPPGLIASNIDSHWLTQSANESSEYQAITAAPLFEKQGSLTYRPNTQQQQSLCRYLDAIKASTQQSLEEPYTVNFAIGVVN